MVLLIAPGEGGPGGTWLQRVVFGQAMTGALSALPSSVSAHPGGVRFTLGQAEEVIAAIGAALADAELTVDELTEAIADRTGDWAVEQTVEAFQSRWPRWRQLTSTAAHRGMLCFGPDRGRKVTYTNPHRWLPGFRPADGDTALRTLVSCYLHAYGRIRTCAHGSREGCCIRACPAGTCSQRSCPGAYRAQPTWPSVPGAPWAGLWPSGPVRSPGRTAWLRVSSGRGGYPQRAGTVPVGITRSVTVQCPLYDKLKT